MIGLLVGFAILMVVGGFGRNVTSRFSVLQDSPMERLAFSCAIGFGILGYGVYFMGLIGHGLLTMPSITALLLLLGLVGFRGVRANLLDLRGSLQQFRQGVRGERVLVAICLVLLLLFGLVSLLACFMAPTGQAWDAVSYHLADPKVFLRQGQITILPTDHHSNFPFLMEMLFLVGLLFAGFSLANLFHWIMGLLCVVALVGFGRRRLGNASGWIGALIFVTTPVVLWQASIAYIDIAVGLYTLLGGIATVEALMTQEEQERKQWVMLAGILVGFALGLKYLALLAFGTVVLILLIRRIPVKQVLVFGLIAGVIASPWYLKNVVMMGNPVYPYMYKIFPNSRYWSAERGRVYDSEQQGFGYSHSLKQPAETAQNLLLTPWRMLGNAEKFSNQGEYTFMALFGGLWAALIFAGLLMRGVPLRVRILALMGLLQLLAWFFLAQVSRYLVSVLPLLAVGAGYLVHRLLFESQLSRNSRLLQRFVVVACVGGQSFVTALSFVVLPVNGRVAMESGVLPTVVNLSEMLSELGGSSATSPRLTKSLEYPAIQWLNTNTDSKAGVVLYEETRGFYLERPYLWGNGEHSSYIPYERFQSGAEMSDWFLGQGFRYALVNLNWSSKKGDPEMPTAPIHLEREALRRWYVDTVEPVGWRGLVADALRRDIWRVVYAERGVAILEIVR